MGHAISESSRRLMRLIESFLIYTQLELLKGDPTRADLLRKKRTDFPAQVVEEKARAAAKAAGRPSDLVLRLEDRPVPMAEEYLSKIADELVQNAFKFSATQTPVHVTLAAADPGVIGFEFSAAQAPVRLPQAPADPGLMLTVSDQGCGLSTEQIAKVGAYMQFDRKLKEQQGLGLGLTICRRLAELHGGSLTIQSQPGVGTTVSVHLPAA
jgi:signal transduction histidine kinase